MKRTLWLLGLLAVIPTLFAQTAADGERQFNFHQYAQAQATYQALLQNAPANVLYKYRLARCYFEQGKMTQAAELFEAAGDKYPLRNFYLGECYFALYRFEEAATAYGLYVTADQVDADRVVLAQKRMQKCTLGARLLARVADVAIVDSVSVDKDAFLTKYGLSAEAGKLTVSQGMGSYTNQRTDRQMLTTDVNGRTQLFSRERLLDAWGTPQRLSDKINASGNVNFPFVASDGLTLYFAADGENSLGGYDIFMTCYNAAADGYLMPENMGMPFNSPANDYMLAIDETQGLGWFATDRSQPAGRVMVYTFVPNEETRLVRNVPADSLVRLASLDAFRSEKKPTRALPAVVATVPAEHSTFTFAVRNGLVYRHDADFHSAEALQAFHDYCTAKRKYDDKRQQLDGYRKRYQAADADERAHLAPAIMAVERTLAELSATADSTQRKARQLEIELLQTELQKK